VSTNHEDIFFLQCTNAVP